MPEGRGKRRVTEAPPIATGAVIADKYVVETVLGTGAMGYVVAARHKLIGQRVAIKLIKSSYIDDADALERFMREARTLAAIESENVVRVLDYGKMPDESPYLVMELLSGRDLLAELRARGPLPLAETAEIVLQACEGLAAVHARGIVHRDVKPANLFLTTRANGKLLVKLVDFGISKAPKLNDDELSLTRNSLGSPHYMSPEQLRSARKVDARSDVWSLGVTLYRTLAGELPFGGESVGSLMAAVMTGQPRPIRAYRPELPPELEPVLARCLEKSADDRFANVHELADALAPFATQGSLRPHEKASREPSSRSPASSRPPVARDSTTTGGHVRSQRLGRGDGDARRRRNILTFAIGGPLVLSICGLALAPRGARQRWSFAPGAATVITDAPLPKGVGAEAAAAYETGLQQIRDASFISALGSFERAASLDPTMAGAELRAAVYSDSFTDPGARRHARAAIALRGSLSDDDAALLDAVAPLYVPERPDVGEAERRLDAFVAKRPRNAELVFLTGYLFFATKPPIAELGIADRALALDPRFAGALWLRAGIEAQQWDRPFALHAVEECMVVSPEAASCLRVRASIESLDGECAALESDARRMVAMESVGYRAYEYLATALFARGASIDAVREALRLKWRASPAGERQSTQLLDEAHLALATGDFDEAAKDASALSTLAEASGLDGDRVAAAKLQVALRTELGEPLVAAQVADAWLRRAGESMAADSIDADPRPYFLAAAARGGLRTPLEREATRAEWVALWNAGVEPQDRARVWLEGYAAPAETREEAEAALVALKRYLPLPTLLPSGGWLAPAIGKVHALAGHPADALSELRFVTSSCRTLGAPDEIIRARYQLGEALEATGDAVGACASYAEVVAVWGGEKRSVTANMARSRLEALGCATPAEPSR